MNPKVERKFIGTTSERFQLWCEQRGQEATPENFLIWLIKHNYIPQTTVKRAFVVQEVADISHCRNIPKTRAVYVVEDEYGIPERTAYQILKQHSNTFR